MDNIDETDGQAAQIERSKVMLLWFGIISICMMFAGLTSAYVVLQADHFWVQADLPTMFWISSVVIVLSSLTVWYAAHSVQKGDVKGLRLGLWSTLVLGLLFTATQNLGWKELQTEGKFFVSHISDLKGVYGTDYKILMQGRPLLHSEGNFYKPDDIALEQPINERVNSSFNVSGSFLFILSGLHLAHLLGGLAYLIYVVIRAGKGTYTSSDNLQVRQMGTYWHFLDLLWIYLFLFLQFIR
jgi:cytochrome c oxidase subunit 3